MKKLLLITLLVSIIIIGCKKDDPDGPQDPGYQIITGSITNITNTSASVEGKILNINGKNVTKFGHVWSISQNPTIDLDTKTEFDGTNADTSFISQITKLEKNTSYNVRAYTIDNNGIFYGEEQSLKTTDNFFKFIVSSQYLINDSQQEKRGWILIYSSGGQLLDYKEIFNGNSYEFDWPTKKASDNYMVQLFFETKYDTSLYYASARYNLNCMLDIVPDIWYLGSEPEEETKPDQIGTNTITLNDIDLSDFYIYEIKNKFDYGWFSGNQIELKQYFNPDNIYIMFMNEEEPPYYKWFGNVALNDTYTIGSAAFTEMTDFVNIEFPQGNSDVVYIESEDDITTNFWDYYMVFYNSANNQTSIKSYYPGNLFSGYYTYLRAYKDNVSEYMYRRRGAIPSKFVSIDANINVTNNSINNFTANIIGEADVINCYWANEENEGEKTVDFSYSISGASDDIGSYSAPDLPAEITTLNESILDLSKLEYSGTRFYEYDIIIDFEDYITKQYVQSSNLYDGVVEYYRKYVYQDGKNGKITVDPRAEIDRLKRSQFER